METNTQSAEAPTTFEAGGRTWRPNFRLPVLNKISRYLDIQVSHIMKAVDSGLLDSDEDEGADLTEEEMLLRTNASEKKTLKGIGDYFADRSIADLSDILWFTCEGQAMEAKVSKDSFLDMFSLANLVEVFSVVMQAAMVDFGGGTASPPAPESEGAVDAPPLENGVAPTS